MDTNTGSYPALGLLALGHEGLDLLQQRIEKPTPIQTSQKRRTLLLGWDALDWKLVNQFREKGVMPTLDRLIRNGVSGKIATLDPPFSPMLWTSIATGKTADKHGVLGFFEKHGDSARPVQGSARQTRALWNIFGSQGLKSNVVNWWPSHPAEQINGNMISNHAYKLLTKKAKLVVPGNCMYPENLRPTLRPYFVHPNQLRDEQVLPFLPDATNELLKENQEGVTALAKILSKCVSAHAHSTWLMNETEWDFLAVYHDAIDHACHGFMKFFPPRLPGVPKDKFALYHYVIEGMYRFHDMMLERLLNLAGENTDVIVLSDHGFHSDHLRPTNMPKMDAAPALEHSPFGVVVMHGPSFKQGEQVTGASLLDVAPTLLHLRGLAVGKDMNGRVLAEAFREDKPISFINSWDEVEGDFGEQRLGTQADDAQVDDETLVQLIELGYVDGDSKNLKDLSHKAEVHQLYNLARVYINKHEMARAIFILNELLEKDREDIRYNISLITCYLAMGETQGARAVLNAFKAINKSPHANLMLLEARVLQEEQSHFLALEVLEKARLSFSRNPQIPVEIGFTHLQLSQFEKAQKALDQALDINPQSSRIFLGKSIAHLRQGNLEEAIQYGLDSVELTYAFPKAHAILGEAFEEAGMFPEAAQAYETALSMAPNLTGVRSRLVDLYETRLQTPERAEAHKEFIQKPLTEIILVSGLPRSGTSMMMQMLEAGGISPLTDGEREADENNPKGYYEYEPVKRLADDVSWLPKADGKALEIVAPLLRYLPRNFRYKVIFMKRDLSEVVRSQQIMLGKDPDVLPMGLFTAYERELQNLALWEKLQPHASVLELDYPTVVANPGAATKQLASFLNKPLDEQAMRQVVDPTLHRNK